MFDKNSRDLECPDRQAESANEYEVCPECGTAIRMILTRGPSEHFFGPCGCRASPMTIRELTGEIDRGREVVTDGGRTLAELHAFERDLLYAVRALEQDDPPKGLAIKSYLEREYAEEVNHSRLYQNLDGLIEHNLLTKGAKDDRTNEYATTKQARTLLEAHAKRRANQTGLTLPSDNPETRDHAELEETTEIRARAGEQ